MNYYIFFFIVIKYQRFPLDKWICGLLQRQKVHLYLNEISSYVVIVCSGDGFSMLGNELQTLQYFGLRPAEVWATYIKYTQTFVLTNCLMMGYHQLQIGELPVSPCSCYSNSNVLPGCRPLSFPSRSIAAQPAPTFIKHTAPSLISRHRILTQPAAHANISTLSISQSINSLTVHTWNRQYVG